MCCQGTSPQTKERQRSVTLSFVEACPTNAEQCAFHTTFTPFSSRSSFDRLLNHPSLKTGRSKNTFEGIWRVLGKVRT